MLHEKLNISNLDDLEKAATEHRIRRLPRMERLERRNIQRSIERYKKKANVFSTAQLNPLSMRFWPISEG